jgi:CheY-like chemotaxis protein
MQIDDARIPAPQFKVRCPSCSEAFVGRTTAQKAVDSNGNSSGSSAPNPAVGDSPVDAQALLRALAALLQGNARALSTNDNEAKKICRVMICASPAPREAIMRALQSEPHAAQYEIAVVADTAQAVDMLREERCDVLMLDAEFEAVQKGAAFIKRELQTLRPAQRRRLFIVSLANNARTADAHEAFINDVNLSVNYKDIQKLPHLLEEARRDFADLYRDFYAAQSKMV